MKRMTFLLWILCYPLFCYSSVESSKINPDLLKGKWNAQWITVPDIGQREYGVYHFRKKINIDDLGEEFIIHVSADNRYRLFINGESVCFGPARGDLHNWYFETLDIAPYLKKGENVIAATVWNMGVNAPVAQISNQTGFILQGNTPKEEVINTNGSWRVVNNTSYTACSLDNGARLRAYMVVGPGDYVEGKYYPWGWQNLNYNDDDWKRAIYLAHPTFLSYGTDNLWNLTPRNIPLMEESLQRMKEVRLAKNIAVSNEFLKGSKSIIIPPNTEGTILIDQGFNTTAFPLLKTTQGKNSFIKLTYAEALFDDNMQKGNRDEVGDRKIVGNYDVFLPDGGESRSFSPLWFRTYRYIELEIKTQEEELILEDFYGMYTGYPFKSVASFESNDPTMRDIWDVGWRTARLCAGETYYDCPYYEQLQYPGDTRIQALISLYVTGDDRLMRKAILDFYNSRTPIGLTQGRYPSSRLQIIPPYSLYWISMIYDYWMHCGDDQFVSQFLPAIHSILSWYERHIDDNVDMLGGMGWWNFTDYTDVFPNGVAPGSNDGNSSVLTLHYAYTLNQAIKLFESFGDDCLAEKYATISNRIRKGTMDACFDTIKGVFGDTPDKKSFSQHVSIMGVLSQAIEGDKAREVMNRVVHDETLGPVTFYYRFYLTQALKQVGLGDLYYPSLSFWRDMLAIGLTTFAEKPEPARSDCHAWSASPLYDYFAVICGIKSKSSGFEEIEIAPSLSDLKEINASMPHPKGEIKVKLQKVKKNGVQGEIVLPRSTTGVFIWNNSKITLSEGFQKIGVE